jgi:hypothetical protein
MHDCGSTLEALNLNRDSSWLSGIFVLVELIALHAETADHTVIAERALLDKDIFDVDYLKYRSIGR